MIFWNIKWELPATLTLSSPAQYFPKSWMKKKPNFVQAHENSKNDASSVSVVPFVLLFSEVKEEEKM
jgi:hypothetical protein